MSKEHSAVFDRIRVEYVTVKELLRIASSESKKVKIHQKDLSSGQEYLKSDIMDEAINTLNDAYALILIAKAEAFVREYLQFQGVSLRKDPNLSYLIQRYRKEFNKVNPSNQITDEQFTGIDELRKQRNNYAHGYGTKAFVPVGTIVALLGKFFH